MIHLEQLTKIGFFGKPHGIKGEITIIFHSFSFELDECRFIFCELDGIFVPFVIESLRLTKKDVAFIKLKGIDSETDAKTFTNKEVYFQREYVTDNISADDPTWNDLIGFRLIDELRGDVGEIVDIDDSTLNLLFIIQQDQQEFAVPAHIDFIIDIRTQEKILFARLPEGILEL